jgi:hypothetical protein
MACPPITPSFILRLGAVTNPKIISPGLFNIRTRISKSLMKSIYGILSSVLKIELLGTMNMFFAIKKIS